MFLETNIQEETSRTSRTSRTGKTSVQEEQVYDVPRPNSEALYFNQNFEDDLQTYDTPRTGKSVGSEIDHIQSDYDVPKVIKIQILIYSRELCICPKQ